MDTRTITPSSYQQAILDAAKNTNYNILIEAVAGSGKSSTLEMIFFALPHYLRMVLLAFNKSVKIELLSRGLPANTFHSLGLSEIFRAFGRVTPDFNKTGKIMKRVMSFDDMTKHGGSVSKLVSAAYSVGLVPDTIKARRAGLKAVTSDSDETWLHFMEIYGINDFDDKDDRFTAVSFAREVLTECLLNTKIVSGDDMLAMPVLYDMPMKKYDVVGVDEAQDSAIIQLAFLDKIVGKRIIAVGDRNQQLYTFRGADSTAMDRIKRRYQCVELPLSICYRCPQKVVEYAQRFVPQIEARPNAPDGIIEAKDTYTYTDFQPGDLVVCRMNFPAVNLAYRLIAHRVPVAVIGRDIGQGLIAKIKKIKDSYDEAERTDPELPFLLTTLEARRGDEIEKALARGHDRKIDSINDKYDTLDVVIESCVGKTMQNVIDELGELFRDSKDVKGKVMISSIHKIKGGQAKRVFWLDSDIECKVKTLEDAHTEQCCKYVAVTRAQAELYFIESGGWI